MVGTSRRLYGSLVLALVLSSMSAPASAQNEENSAAARALATQGVSAYNEGRYADASDLFTRAESLLHAPPHVLFMARSAEKLGQLVRARELYLKLTREELAANAPEAFRDAQAQAREEVRAIEPRLASVTIVVKAPPGVKVKVEMDGKPLTAAVLGVPIPADPGKHQVTASAEGYVSDPIEITLTEGGKGQGELVLRSADGKPAAAAPPPDASGSPAKPPPPAEGSNRAWMRPVSYAAFGVGVLGLGAGAYFFLDSRSARKDADAAEKKCNATSNGCETTDSLAKKITELDGDARTSFSLAIAGAAVGVVGATVGTVLFVMSSKKEPQAARVVPWVGIDSIGLTGTW